VTIDFDRLLRDTVHELAAEGRPVDLTAPALRTARRIRTQRTIAAVASACVLVVGIGVAVIRTGGIDRSAPPAERSPSPVTSSAAPEPTRTESLPPGSAPVSLPGGWLIRAAPARAGAIMYDTGLGRYRSIGTGPRVAPSPNGQFMAEVSAEGQVVIRRTDDEREVARGSVALRDSTMYPVWTADSSRAAYLSGSAQSIRLVILNVDGTETLSTGNVPCTGGCVPKWLENGQRVRVTGTSTRADVTAATGVVGAVSATPDDPCGFRFAGYQISNPTWLCVTPDGFAVTYPDGTVTERVPFPTSLDGIGVTAGNIDGYVLFRPK
jgi:hypothetical protein